MIEKILSILFPPRLGRIRNWEPETRTREEQGWAGNVRPRLYRNGIERYFAEEAENS